MSKQASKKNIAQNNETFVATLASGVLPNAVGVENQVLSSLGSTAKNKQNKKSNAERAIDEGVELEQANLESQVFDQISEELALVDGLIEGDAELTLTQARSNDGAAAFFGAEGWNILGGALLLGGVAALVGGGGGGGSSGSPVGNCVALDVTDEDLVLTADLTNINDINVLATSADVVASLVTSADVEIYLCNDGSTNNLLVEASGEGSSANVGITVVGNLDNIDIIASGYSSDVDFNMELDGNINGDILISSTSASADTSVLMLVDGDINSSTLEIEATADDSHAGAMITTAGDINVGSVSVVAGVSECADIIGADAGLFIGASGDITVTNGISADAYENASVDLYVGATGSITANLNLEASGEDSLIEFGGISGLSSFFTSGEDGFSETWTGDIILTASGFNSEIRGEDAAFGVTGDIFGADSGIMVLGSYQGDSINFTADGENSLITAANVSVIGGDMSSGSDAEPLNIALSANGASSDITLSGVEVLAGDLTANVTLTAGGLDSFIGFNINTDVSEDINESNANWNGDLTVVSSGQSSEIDLYGDIDGQWRGNVTVTDFYVDADSIDEIGDDVIVDINLNANNGFSGDLTVTALGVSSDLRVSIDVDNAFNMVSEVTLTADGVNSYIEVSLDTDNSFIGNVTAKASELRSDVDIKIDADESFEGNITLTASATDTEIKAEIDADDDHFTGNVTLNASGTNSDISIDLDVETYFSGDITLNASGSLSNISLELDVNNGDFLGTITLNASGTSSEIDFSTEIDGASTGNFNITASGEDSNIDFSFDTDANVNGDLIASATGIDAYIDIDLLANHQFNKNASEDELGNDYLSSITMDTQITATASAESAQINVYASVEVSVDLYGYSAGDEIGTVTASSLYLGDVVLTANAEAAEVNFEIDLNADVDLISTDLEDSELTSISALAKFSGDITANATATNTNIGVDVYVNANVSGGTLTNAQRISEADFEGDITLTASGRLSDISLDLYVEDDMVGNIDLIASGISSYIYAAGYGPSDNEIDIGGDFTGNLDGLASGTSSDIDVSMDVNGDFNGTISLIATGIDSQILACIDVDGDINGDIILRADTSLPDYEHDGSDVSVEISADDINGDIYIESANLAGNSNVGAFIDVNAPGINISEQLVGDIFISGGYTNNVNVIFDDMFSDLIEMTGITGSGIEDAENEFYGQLDLVFNSNSNVAGYSYWYNAINEASGEISDLHNRYMEINGFTGINADDASINDLDTIEFNNFGDEGYISQYFGDGNSNNSDFYNNDLHEHGGTFADLQEFLADAHSTLSGGTDEYNNDNDSDLDYNAVQFFTGTIGNDYYLAVGSNVQDQTGMSYLIRFNEFAGDSSSFESLALQNTTFVYDPN